MPAYGVVPAGAAGMSPEQVKKVMESVMWWAGLAAGLFSPTRGMVVSLLTPILTSDEFCEKLARLLSRKKAGDKVTYSDLENA